MNLHFISIDEAINTVKNADFTSKNLESVFLLNASHAKNM